MNLLQISLLGGFNLHRGDTALLLHTRKAEAMVAYLAWAARPFSREELAAFFWPESDPAQAAANLRKQLSELRTHLASYLHITRQSVALANFWLDVSEFEQLATGDEAAQATAVPLYQGDFLTGLYLRDSLPFDEWASLQRERLQQMMIHTLRRLATYHLHQGTYEQGLTYVNRWLALDPLAEAAHRLAMRLYTRHGRRNAALAQFDRCRHILEEELGVPPMPATIVLYEKIQETAARPPRLPHTAAVFMGRTAELSQLSHLLDDPAVRLITLTGPGGSGKTRLALQAAARCASDFRHGVHLVRLEQIEPNQIDPQDALFSALVTALDIPLSDKQPLPAQLHHYLHGKELLLLLDNFEHLAAAARLLPTFLDHAPQLKCLVTSRIPLQVANERVLQIYGLPYPTEIPPQPETYAALTCFAAGARQVVPDFALTAATLPHVVQICRLVDGLPLGLELAARAVRAFSPAQIAAQMEHDPDFLDSRTRDLPTRHRSLRLIFDYTWQLLSAAEQVAFVRITVFPGPFTAAAAQAVAEVTAGVLQQLANKVLLQIATADHYQLHDLLRRYGLEKLAQDSATAAAAYVAHAHYYANLLHEIQPQLESKQQREALSTIRHNLPHLRQAWRWGVEQANTRVLAQLLTPMGRFWTLTGLYQEGAEMLGQALLALETAVAPEIRLVYIRCLIQRAAFLCGLGSYETAAHDLTTALAEAQTINAAPEIAACYREQGKLALTRSQLDQAEQKLSKSLQHYQAAEDEGGAADVWHKLGQTYIQLSQPTPAESAFNNSLEICRRLNQPHGIALALSGLAVVSHYWSGDYNAAESLYLEALDLKRDLGHRHGMANDLNNLGNLACNQQAFEQAIIYYEESLAIKRDVGLPLGIAITLSNLGTAHQELGQQTQAAALYEESLGISQKLGDEIGVLFCLTNLADLAYVQGAYEVAERRWRRVVQLSLAAQTPDRLLYCLTGLARLWADPDVPTCRPVSAATLFYYVQTHPGCNQGIRDKIAPPLARLETTLPAETLATAQAQAAVWHTAEDITEQVRDLLEGK